MTTDDGRKLDAQDVAILEGRVGSNRMTPPIAVWPEFRPRWSGR